MRPGIFATMLFVLGFASTAASAQELWRGTRLGMTVAEAKQQLPDAADFEPTPGTTLDRGQNAGAQKRLVASLELAGERFDASLYFKDGKLVQVSLSARAENDNSRLYPFAYQEILATLRAKYGREVRNTNSSSRTFGDSAEMAWTSGRTTIALYLSMSKFVTIRYDALLSEIGDKL